ncbi:TetR/AcrR family transcriptional regulator [Streptomyces kunmingensis]|uniref:TetR/AcrR family transcriptional regulator n=2 Tax=Streptomyces kunmingensis TaxID=68225 RepID=A0ABU6C9Q3_9ACTN|nr:TetR/AcrR family transcriptional regulator [Streptomyces kunmingensis]MEB3961448.1 TetR/AcrR family transcriptional regulator [Streptomyces kunmingensis]
MVSEQTSAVAADPRFTRSRQAIADALADLMERTRSCPSVSALAEAAGIHRATFYNHFDSVEEAAVYVIADDFRALHDLNIRDRHRGADPTAVAVATLNAMLDSLRQRKSLFLLASTWRSSSGLMGIGDLLLEQLHALRRDLGVDEQESGANNSVEDVYTASGVHGVFSAAVGGNTDCDPEEITVRLYALLPQWIRRPPESSSTHVSESASRDAKPIR